MFSPLILVAGAFGAAALYSNSQKTKKNSGDDCCPNCADGRSCDDKQVAEVADPSAPALATVLAPETESAPMPKPEEPKPLYANIYANPYESFNVKTLQLSRIVEEAGTGQRSAGDDKEVVIESEPDSGPTWGDQPHTWLV